MLPPMRFPLPLLILPLLTSCGAVPPQAQGVVEADEETLAFAVPGRVVVVAVAEGQAIAAGTEVARLDGEAQRLALAQAEAEAVLAQARLAQVRAAARPESITSAEAREVAAQAARVAAVSERDRQVELLRTGNGSVRDRDRAVDEAARTEAEAIAAAQSLASLKAGGDAAAVAVAEAQVAVAHAAVAVARDAVAKTVLSSPPGPRVVRHQHLRPGELAPAGVPVVTVADLSRPYVDAFVPEAVAATLKPGASASVRIDGQPLLTATVERVGERLEYTPRYLFGPADRPHLMVRVRVRLPGPAPAAGVPADVVFSAP